MKHNAAFKEHELADKKFKAKNLKGGEEEYIKVSDKKISVGDQVKIISYQRNGVINKELSDGKFEVLMGALTLKCSEDELEYVGKQPKQVKPRKNQGGT